MFSTTSSFAKWTSSWFCTLPLFWPQPCLVLTSILHDGNVVMPVPLPQVPDDCEAVHDDHQRVPVPAGHLQGCLLHHWPIQSRSGTHCSAESTQARSCICIWTRSCTRLARYNYVPSYAGPLDMPSTEGPLDVFCPKVCTQTQTSSYSPIYITHFQPGTYALVQQLIISNLYTGCGKSQFTLLYLNYTKTSQDKKMRFTTN